ncbi:glycoside hydrolase, family 10 [Lachnospiraceae bacterium TWA4]|nr:glycoside hydrolase, family 10 [Lachnospiraceae bacterium TWA4]
MRREITILGAILVLLIAVVSGCGRKDNTSIEDTNNSTTISENNTNKRQDGEIVNLHRLPEQIIELPDEYYRKMDGGGILENLNYTTYESFTYADKSQTLDKRAVVYLPEGYDESKKYNVLYLMHGGWSDETVYLGSLEGGKGMFANVLDHAIANGQIDPLIVVSPTYNNTSLTIQVPVTVAITVLQFSLPISTTMNFQMI